MPPNINVKNFQEFSFFLEDLGNRFAEKGVAKSVHEKLMLRFERVRSFTGAVISATQSIVYSTLVWAGL